MHRQETKLTGSSSGERGAASDGVVDRVVSRCLADAGRFSVETIEKVCREQPQCAGAVRAQFDVLRRAGLLGAIGDAGRAVVDGDADEDGFEPVGPYQPLEELGRGGQAVVYLAEDLRLHRPVALKVLKGLGALSETVLRRFRREAQVTSKLDHPGICPVYDASVVRGTPYIAMRYVAGMSLADCIREARKHPGSRRRGHQISLSSDDRSEGDHGKRPRSRRPRSHRPQSRGSVPSAERCDLHRILAAVEKVARALHVAHEAGIVHRDVKPSNIMIDSTGEPVLLDFGLAGDEESGTESLTQTGELLGTPAYLSPEQLAAKHVHLDRRTDVYSLGVTLFECLTLRRPFKAASREALHLAIQFKPPADARKLNPTIPADLKVVIDTALAKERDQRYRTALDLAEDLRRVRESEPIMARPVGTVGRLVRWAKRRPARAALAILLVVGVPLVAGLTGYILANGPLVERDRQAEIARKTESFLAAGFTELSHGTPEGAVKAFDDALDETPNSVEAVGGHLAVRLSQGAYQQCLDFLASHAALEERFPDLGHFRRRALVGLGRAEEARRLEGRIPASSTPKGFFLRGLALMDNEESPADPAVLQTALQDALDNFKVAVFTTPRVRAFYHYQLARAAGRLGDGVEAPRVADALTTQWKTAPEASFWAGWALHRVDPKAAVRYYHQALKRKPEWFAPMAGIVMSSDDPGEIIRVGERALTLRPGVVSLIRILGRAYLATGKSEQGLDCLSRAAALREADPEAHLACGRAYLELGRPDDAVRPLQRAVELAVQSNVACPDAHAALGEATAASGNVSEAIEQLKKAADDHPESARILHALGHVLFDYARSRIEALKVLRHAVALPETKTPGLHRELGNVLVATGHLTEAQPHFVQAYALTRSGSSDKAERQALSVLTSECPRLATRLPLLEIYLHEGREPDLARTAVDMARLAAFDNHSLAAATLFDRAFTRKPELEADRCPFLGETFRHVAAVEAVRLGCGTANDGGDLSDQDRAGWRKRARAWLEQDLNDWRQRLSSGGAPPRALRTRLIRWQHDPRLDGIRDKNWRRRRLPSSSERSTWRAFWRNVKSLLRETTTAPPNS